MCLFSACLKLQHYRNHHKQLLLFRTKGEGTPSLQERSDNCTAIQWEDAAAAAAAAKSSSSTRCCHKSSSTTPLPPFTRFRNHKGKLQKCVGCFRFNYALDSSNTKQPPRCSSSAQRKSSRNNSAKRFQLISVDSNYISKGIMLSESKRFAQEIAENIKVDKPIGWHFDDREYQILKDSTKRIMATVAEPEGRQLFERVFQYDQAFKTHVKEKRNYSDERIESLFRTHSERVHRILSEIVQSVNSVDYVFERLHNLGKKHSAFKVEELHMDLMLCNFLDVAQRFDWEFWSEDIEAVWLKFLKIALAVLLVGLRNDVSSPDE